MTEPTIETAVPPNVAPTSTVHCRAGVSDSRSRKPFWMSEASSVPAVIAANSAPCTKQTTIAKLM